MKDEQPRTSVLPLGPSAELRNLSVDGPPVESHHKPEDGQIMSNVTGVYRLDSSGGRPVANPFHFNDARPC